MGYISSYLKALFLNPILTVASLAVNSASATQQIANCLHVDTLIKNTQIIDGSGKPSSRGDLAILGDKLVIPAPTCSLALRTLDGTGLYAAPGFINSLSWGAEALFFDQTAQSDLTQGITHEVFGEGWSLGPLSEQMANDEFGGKSRYGIEWRSFQQGMLALESKKVAVNFSSYVGGSTLRKFVMGNDTRRPATPEELSQILKLAKTALFEGALGVGLSLESEVGSPANSAEILALAHEVESVNALLAAHLRSEGVNVNTALDDMLSIASTTKARVEILHLKVSGGADQHYQQMINSIETARKEGLLITANMYPYNVLATSPKYLENYETNGRFSNISPEQIYIPQNQRPTVPLASLLKSPSSFVETIVKDLTSKDSLRRPVLIKFTNENNLLPPLSKTWVSVGTDASTAGKGNGYFYRLNHPRAFGAFPKYLRLVLSGEIPISFEEAISNITSRPAEKFRLCGRGKLANGYYADLVLLDLDVLQDRATLDSPRQLSTGVQHLFVNGVHTVDNGAIASTEGGRFVPRAAEKHSDLSRCHL